MENRVQPKERTGDDLQAFLAMIVLLICVECSKEPEFRCENCDKVYKQEGRYRAHLAKCIVKDGDGDGDGDRVAGLDITRPIEKCVSASEFAELLRQNREMLMLLQKQQETIQVLVTQLVVPLGKSI